MTIAVRPLAPASTALRDDDHEQIVIRQDPETGMRFIVAVHSTVLGPALGGMRLKRYPGGLKEALEDVMGLARTMTLKASAAGLDLGGGKAVMIDDGRYDLRQSRLAAAAAVIEGLGGAYITAEDIGTTTADMDHVARFTRFCVGRSLGNGGGGDPSPVTAQTVFEATRRGLAAHDGSGDLEGRRIGVIGIGKVGGSLAARFVEAGARVVAYDVDPVRCRRFAAEHDGVELAPSVETVLATELDVLAPCAAGGLIDDSCARALDVRVVAGAANNPLTGRRVARTLMEREILYVPDFLANCGGLIHVADEWQEREHAARASLGSPREHAARASHGSPREHAARASHGSPTGRGGPSEDDLIAGAMDSLDRAIAAAEREGLTPLEVAERQALERVEAARR